MIDRNHPVGLGNGELIGLDMAKEFCPDVDFVASIIYRGKTFGNLFNSLKSTFDKPLLLDGDRRGQLRCVPQQGRSEYAGVLSGIAVAPDHG